MKRTFFALGLSTALVLAVGSASAEGPSATSAAATPPSSGSSSPDAGAEAQRVLRITLAADGSITVDTKPVADDEAFSVVVAAAKRESNPNGVVRALVQADATVPHGRVIHVLDLLNRAGISKVSFGVVAAPEAPAQLPETKASVPPPDPPMVRARRRPKPRYGASGCGLGSIIFGPKAGIAQVTAASTNTTGFQTFGLTSGTMNCDSIDDHETLDSFVAMNREALTKDVARGSGETIATLTAIAGCADPVTVGKKLKASFAKIFPGPRAQTEQIARSIRTLLKADVALACENLPE